MFCRFFLVLFPLLLAGCIAATSVPSFDRPGRPHARGETTVDRATIACVEYQQPRTRIFKILVNSDMTSRQKEFMVLRLCSPKFDTVSKLAPPSPGEGSRPPSSKLRIIFDILPSGRVTNARYFQSDFAAYYRGQDNELTRHSVEAVENFIFTPQKDQSGAPEKTRNVIMTFKYYVPAA